MSYLCPFYVVPDCFPFFFQVIEVGSLNMTNCDTGSVLLDEERHDAFKNLSNSLLNTGVSFGFQPQDLYDHFEVKIYDFEVKFLRF